MLDSRVWSVLTARSKLQPVSDQRITQRAMELRWQAEAGRPLRRMLVEAFGLASEATRRVTGKNHYPVQIFAAIKMFSGCIVEMQTGEGKTLTAVLPVALRAMCGRGAHVLTANEYLATRDAEALKDIFGMLGLTLSPIRADMDDQQRMEAYQCDITYATAGEVGFDFLRDRMKKGVPESESSRAGPARPVQRDFHFALVDEADSILIDDARTPLIIGSERNEHVNKEELCRWACAFAQNLVVGEDYLLNPQRRSADLSEYGSRRTTLVAKPSALMVFDNEEIFQHVERAIVARQFYVRDRDYIIMEDNSVAIVDEGTGRLMEERRWQAGLHQAIEAKEGVPLSTSNCTVAKIALQTLFRRYDWLAGMTGTATGERKEFAKVYNLPIVVVPTHRRCMRTKLPTRIFISQAVKYIHVAHCVQDIIGAGRAVLIGTPSVEASEALSRCLHEFRIEHSVLNCRAHARESEIVASAGQPRTVTISTNMAGRGTDILLHEAVRSAGGLHVIATERHTSARLDRQLIGRCARQGDPGSFQFMLSFEDELLRALAARRYLALVRHATVHANEEGELPPRFENAFGKCQRALERLHARNRRQLLKQEKDRHKAFVKMSLDPFIELLEE